MYTFEFFFPCLFLPPPFLLNKWWRFFQLLRPKNLGVILDSSLSLLISLSTYQQFSLVYIEAYQNMNILTTFVIIILDQATIPLKSLFKWHISPESSLTVPYTISTTIYIPRFSFHTTFFLFLHLINHYTLYILLILFVNYFPFL